MRGGIELMEGPPVPAPTRENPGSGSQCDKTILKMGGTRGNVSICGSLYSENKRVGGNVNRTVVIQM